MFRSLRRIIHLKQVKGFPLVYDDRMEKGNEIQVSSYEDYLIDEETNTEKSWQLHEVIKSLSKRQIECLTLKFEHNLTYIEISEVLGISVESTRTMIYRTLKELRKCFDEKRKLVPLLLFMITIPHP